MGSAIVYYSRADENYFGGALRFIQKGNTEIVAEALADLTGIPLFKIEQKKPYSQSYNACISEAQKDLRANVRPELKEPIPVLSGLKTVYVGGPNYWGTLPMAVFSFLDRIDLKGVEIRLFMTHEGSGLGNAVRDLQRLYPEAIVGKTLAIHGSKASSAGQAIRAWIEEGE